MPLVPFAMGVYDEETTFCLRVPVCAALVGSL